MNSSDFLEGLFQMRENERLVRNEIRRLEYNKAPGEISARIIVDNIIRRKGLDPNRSEDLFNEATEQLDSRFGLRASMRNIR